MYKAIIIVFLIFSFLFFAKAQKAELFTKYYSTYANSNYDINIIYSDTNNYKLEIDLMTYDNQYSKGGLIVTNRTLPSFIFALDTAETYYSKWVVQARVKKGSKRIIKYFQKEKIGGYFYGKNKTRIDYSLNVKYKFRVLRHHDEIIYVLNIYTGKITSQYGHQYIVQSFSLFFLSEQEIKDFRNLITSQKIKEFIKVNKYGI